MTKTTDGFRPQDDDLAGIARSNSPPNFADLRHG